ncbi:MAG: aspartate aminotransferase family protein [Chitinophagia bacterium]|nr:aspartate aminotransferase family protein [Chitinophagia bacterium]
MNQRQLFLQHVAQTSDAPLALEIVGAKGVFLYDVHGKEYIDLISGISVCNIGHSNQQVIDAIKLQVDSYMHLMVYGELIESPQVNYATNITSHLPASLNSVYFTSSGTEATEGAMKLAKRVTGRTNMLAFKDSYHGSTQGALSVMGSEYWRNAFRPLLPGIIHADYNHDDVLKLLDEDIACVILEPIQAEKGVNLPSKEWIKKLRAICSEKGILLIFDEIQTGFGRTGKLFAFEHYDIVPDIILLGKALGGGMPLGAFIANRELMKAFTLDPVLGHITTFGGHPVCCAAGNAAFEFLLQNNLIETVHIRQQQFRDALVHPLIKAFRAAGLLMTIEFESWDTNKKIIDACLERGVFTDWFLFAPHCLRLAPPLIISEGEVKKACEIILSACDEVFKK